MTDPWSNWSVPSFVSISLLVKRISELEAENAELRRHLAKAAGEGQ